MGSTHSSERRVQNGRLVWFRSDSDEDFWERNWQDNLREEYYKPYLEGQLGDFETLFPRFLPKEGKIIEAGCGLAQYVVAMRKRGYDMEGYDLAKETVAGVKSIFPDLPLFAGDVTNLPVEDGYYNAYVSLGVIEHLQSGPEPFLDEANRILEKNGTAFITVPHYNFLRRLKAKFGFFKSDAPTHPFYQYAFSKGELIKLVENAGFEVTHSTAMNSLKGIRDEWVFFRKIFDNLKPNILKRILGKLIQITPFMNKSCGHMLVIIARKK